MYRNFRGMMVLSKEAREFKQAVARIAGDMTPSEGMFAVDIAYHPKARKKETDRPLKRLDCDAHIKPTLDALIGLVYFDDYQVADARCHLEEPVYEGKLVVSWWGL